MWYGHHFVINDATCCQRTTNLVTEPRLLAALLKEKSPGNKVEGNTMHYGLAQRKTRADWFKIEFLLLRLSITYKAQPTNSFFASVNQMFGGQFSKYQKFPSKITTFGTSCMTTFKATSVKYYFVFNFL